MVDSTNIKQIAENIRELDLAIKNAGSGLPDVTVSDAGDVLVVNSDGEWTNGDPPAIFDLDYSATPHKTGYKFMGKDVWRVAIPYANTPDTITVGSTMEFTKPADIETPISGFYVFDGSGGNYGMIIQANQIRVGDTAKVYVDSSSFSGVPGDTFYLIMDYTKLSASNAKNKKKG